MKRMSSQPVFVEGLSLLETPSKNRRVYSQQVLQEAVAIFRPYVAGPIDYELWTTEERAQKWKERHINEIKEASKDYDC